MAEQITKSKKNVKKRFFEVKVPMTAAKIELYAASAEELNNKIIIMDLTKNLRGKNLELKLRVKAEGENLTAEPISARLVSSYMRKVVRKGTDYVEDSFEAECRDMNALVKPFLITRKKVSRAVRNALGEEAKSFLKGYVKVRTVKELFEEIITNKLQRQLSLKLKKIYPLALCEIRIFEIAGAKRAVDKVSEEVKAE